MTQPASVAEIEARLRSLPETLIVGAPDSLALARIVELRIPPASKPAARHLRSAARRRAGRLAFAAAMLIALAVVANAAAAYYAPTYSRALADAPGIGGPSSKILAAFGLNASEVTAINDAATSSGHTLSLDAGYADGLRTVLFVSVDGKGLNADPKGYGMNPGDYGLGDFTLTDQFGHSYKPDGVGTPNWVPFEPLSWPASSIGARLTLQVTRINALWLTGTGDVRGDWSLHGTLVAEPAHMLALPTSVRTANADYTFTSIRASASTLVIRWTVKGPAVDQLNKLWYPNGFSPQTPPSDQYQTLMQRYFSPRVFDASGRQMQLSELGTTFPNHKPASSEITVFITGPGRYRIQCGDALTADDLQRWIFVP